MRCLTNGLVSPLTFFECREINNLSGDQFIQLLHSMFIDALKYIQYSILPSFLAAVPHSSTLIPNN